MSQCLEWVRWNSDLHNSIRLSLEPWGARKYYAAFYQTNIPFSPPLSLIECIHYSNFEGGSAETLILLEIMYHGKWINFSKLDTSSNTPLHVYKIQNTKYLQNVFEIQLYLKKYVPKVDKILY